MLSIIPSATLHGVDGRPVSVEVHVSGGFPGFTVVGLPDAAVRESRDRVRAALLSSGVSWPAQRMTVNLAPSGVRKGGAGLDLPIAVGLLVAMGELPASVVDGLAFLGELGLDGSLRRVPGIVSLVGCLGLSEVVVPTSCAHEACLVAGTRVRSAGSLSDLLMVLRGGKAWPEMPPSPIDDGRRCDQPDLGDVIGQPVGRRALEISAAGGHHLLMVGPPGSGKTMLANRLPGLLPPLAPADAMEVSRVHSAAGLDLGNGRLIDRAPFRAPHHGASEVSIVGGGSSWLRPGEISLAHCGVLFLDELGEFPSRVLDMLRQPLEEGVIRLARARGTATMPARFLLVAAMNPCPCGEGSLPGRCRCSDTARLRYSRRISGPLLDRFDLAVPMARPEMAALLSPGKVEESTGAVASRVAGARLAALVRGVRWNADIPAQALDRVAPLSDEASALLQRRLYDGSLSARGLHRVRRVALTIADLDGSGPPIEACHLAEALALRAAHSAVLLERR